MNKKLSGVLQAGMGSIASAVSVYDAKVFYDTGVRMQENLAQAIDQVDAKFDNVLARQNITNSDISSLEHAVYSVSSNFNDSTTKDELYHQSSTLNTLNQFYTPKSIKGQVNVRVLISEIQSKFDSTTSFAKNEIVFGYVFGSATYMVMAAVFAGYAFAKISSSFFPKKERKKRVLI